MKTLLQKLMARLRGTPPFEGSAAYWEQRYAAGRDSGAGSFDRLAAFKAEVLNAFVRDHHVETVVELGCGDGHQLQRFDFPRYVGYDVSETALRQCRQRFAHDTTKTFRSMHNYAAAPTDLALSLDVIYHLVEDNVYQTYLERLFDPAYRYVIVYASDTDENPPGTHPHVRQRQFTPWVAAHRHTFQLRERIPNPYPYRSDDPAGTSISDFFIYERTQS